MRRLVPLLVCVWLAGCASDDYSNSAPPVYVAVARPLPSSESPVSESPAVRRLAEKPPQPRTLPPASPTVAAPVKPPVVGPVQVGILWSDSEGNGDVSPPPAAISFGLVRPAKVRFGLDPRAPFDAFRITWSRAPEPTQCVRWSITGLAARVIGLGRITAEGTIPVAPGDCLIAGERYRLRLTAPDEGHYEGKLELKGEPEPAFDFGGSDKIVVPLQVLLKRLEVERIQTPAP